MAKQLMMIQMKQRDGNASTRSNRKDHTSFSTSPNETQPPAPVWPKLLLLAHAFHGTSPPTINLPGRCYVEKHNVRCAHAPLAELQGHF
jgi:hypothetical protein